jgi:hypothetical protein
MFAGSEKSDTEKDDLILRSYLICSRHFTIDTLELPGAAGIVELGAVEHVPHPVCLLIMLTAVRGV